MAVKKYSHIRSLMLTALLAAIASSCGSVLYAASGQPAFQVNLESYGGKISKFSGRIDHAVVLLSDRTVWTIFPVQNGEGLLSRGTPNSPGYGILHLSTTGERISQCTWHWPSDASVKDFFPRAERGFVVRTTSSLISFTSDCKEKSVIPSPGPGVEATVDGANLILETDNGLQVVDADSLRTVGSISLPTGLQHFHRAIIWNRLVILRGSAATPCYWTRWTASSLEHPFAWHTVACPEEAMAAFGDDQTIVSNWTVPLPNISLYRLDGSLLYSFPVPQSMRTDTSMFPSDSCLSPGSGRAGIFLFDRKRTWLGQEKVTGEHVEVIDMIKGQSLLSSPVSDSDALLNCSLSQNGKTFALMRGLNLSVFDLAD